MEWVYYYEKGEIGDAERAAILRDMIGNPFCPVNYLDRGCLEWNNDIVVRLAQGIYDDLSFEQMPILGDALEEAGCVDETILDHCRCGAIHVLGCWLLDLLLGKD
jgi:hypothetical protein